MPLVLPGMHRVFVTLALSSVLEACRIGGGDAVPPTESADDPVNSDAGGSATPDGGPVTPSRPDGGDGLPVPGPDASWPLDASVGDAAAPDAACPDGCKPQVSVPDGCTKRERAERVYLVCPDAVRWNDARTICLSAGADLVMIEDEAENAFVAEGLSAASWIGATDSEVEGTFLWIAPGEAGAASVPVSFTRWEAATPDNCLGGLIGQQDCVRIAPNGSWNDSDCAGGCTEGLFGFVCESY